MLFLFYPMLVKLTLSMLKCPSIGHEGKMYLMADLQEPCFVGRHKYYTLLLTIPQLICYLSETMIHTMHARYVSNAFHID